GVVNSRPVESGGFLRRLAEAALAADAQNYRLMRPIVAEMRRSIRNTPPRPRHDPGAPSAARRRTFFAGVGGSPDPAHGDGGDGVRGNVIRHPRTKGVQRVGETACRENGRRVRGAGTRARARARTLDRPGRAKTMATKLSSKKPLFFAVLSLSLSGCCAGKHYIHRGSLAGVRQEFGAGTYTASAYRFRYVTKD